VLDLLTLPVEVQTPLDVPPEPLQKRVTQKSVKAYVRAVTAGHRLVVSASEENG
jgi:hypothetical protein